MQQNRWLWLVVWWHLLLLITCWMCDILFTFARIITLLGRDFRRRKPFSIYSVALIWSRFFIRLNFNVYSYFSLVANSTAIWWTITVTVDGSISSSSTQEYYMIILLAQNGIKSYLQSRNENISGQESSILKRVHHNDPSLKHSEPHKDVIFQNFYETYKIKNVDFFFWKLIEHNSISQLNCRNIPVNDHGLVYLEFLKQLPATDGTKSPLRKVINLTEWRHSSPLYHSVILLNFWGLQLTKLTGRVKILAS